MGRNSRPRSVAATRQVERLLDEWLYQVMMGFGFIGMLCGFIAQPSGYFMGVMGLAGGVLAASVIYITHLQRGRALNLLVATPLSIVVTAIWANMQGTLWPLVYIVPVTILALGLDFIYRKTLAYPHPHRANVTA